MQRVRLGGRLGRAPDRAGGPDSNRVSGFAQEAAVAKSIASYGITYAGRHKQIVRAHCRGLRRYGVQRSGLLDYYHRLTCNLTDADRNIYEAQVLIIRSSSTGLQLADPFRHTPLLAGEYPQLANAPNQRRLNPAQQTPQDLGRVLVAGPQRAERRQRQLGLRDRQQGGL